MSQDWQDFLAEQKLAADSTSFGDLNAELIAARDGTVVVPLTDQGLIRASGEEAAPFLHNLMTNDIATLAADGVRFAGLCSAKGRLLATFTIWRDGADVLLALSADIQPGILKKLSMYVLRSKVKLTDTGSTLVLLGLAGPAARKLIEALGATVPAAMHTTQVAGGKVLGLADGRFMLAITPEAAMAMWPKLAGQARPAGTAAWRWLEIAAGQPRIVAATQEAFVPQMVNMEVAAVAGVSFTKGCYPGQEIVARTQYLGKVKRRMYRGKLTQPLPAGTDVFTPESQGQHCGALVTVAPAPEGGYECLLVVQSSGADAGEIHVGSADGPTAALLSLPYSLG
jgi:folate-binding protein YgfZ